MNYLKFISKKLVHNKFVLLGILLAIAFSTTANASIEKAGSIAQLLGSNETLPFITIWKTDNIGTSTSTQIEIPTDLTMGLVYDYSIYWEEVGNASNNGSATGISGNNIIDFPSAGTYKVDISGIFPKIYFNNGGDKSKILSVEQWGDIVWGDMQFAFYGCNNIVINAADAPDLSNVTTMRGMFRATNMNEPINHWDVSSVIDISYLFRDASQFNQDLSSWNVSNVSAMNHMFMNAASFNQEIGNWDVSQVNRMNSMFSGAEKFNQDIGLWDVGSVTEMEYMFQGAINFNQDISQWNVSNVTNISFMFRNATNFNQPIGHWDIGNVTEMNQLFQNAINFDDDLSNWNISKASNLNYMFRDAISFNQDLSAWDVSNITTMAYMFFGASSFNQDISNWDISNVSNMAFMLKNSGISPYYYDALLNGWLENGVQENINNFQVDGLRYCQGEAARNTLISTHGWNITGDTKDCSQTITFNALSQKNYDDPDFKLNGKVTSGADLYYTSSDENVATISGDTVTIVGVGTTTITASQPGNDYYSGASPISRELKVNKADQTITFDAIPSRMVGDPDFDLQATVNYDSAITYSSSDENVATIIGKTVTIVAEGSTIITASQAGNENYNAATPVEQTLTVNKREQTITFDVLQPKTILDADFDLMATATSGLEVVYSSSDELVATVVNNQVSIVGLGETIITASQTGNAEYAPALEVSRALVVIKAPQEITFESLTDKPSDAPDFDLIAISSSDLQVVFSVSGPATLEGETISLKGTPGVVTVTASQGGDDIYSPAEPIVRTFEIIAVTGIQDLQKEGINIYPNPVLEILTIELSKINKAVVFVYDAKGNKVLQHSLNSAFNKLDLSGLSNGLYFIKIKLADKILYQKLMKK